MPVEQAPPGWELRWPPPGEEFLARPGRAVGWASVLLVLVALGALLIPAGPLALDSRWSELMEDIESSLLTHVALVFNALGHGVWRALTIAGIGVVLLIARRWAALIAFAFAEALTPLLVNLIKLAVHRERPPGQMLDAFSSSFPSGHAAYAAASGLALVLLFGGHGPRRRWWVAAASAVTALMVWSRIYLQVHWLSDAVAGACVGVAVTLLCFGTLQIVLERASPAPTAGCS